MSTKVAPRCPAALLAPGIILTVLAMLSISNSIYIMLTPERVGPKSFDDREIQKAAERGAKVARMAGNPLVIVMYLFVLAGGAAMIKQQFWGLAVAAAVLAMLPCSVLVVLNLPVAIWSLVALNLPRIKRTFR